MVNLVPYEFWFLTGSQHLYGEDTLRQVAADAQKIAASFNGGVQKGPYPVVYKPVLTNADDIEKIIREAEASSSCAGIITWMHTFSPAKMWVRGLNALTKPLLHLNTQTNSAIPYATMDMDFMNLNQSAHGDREFGHVTARMNVPRKVIAGHWAQGRFRERVFTWMRAAAAATDARHLTVARFGDNMRDVAVTDGDKVAAMGTFGWSVPYYGIGDLAEYLKAVSPGDIGRLMEEYESAYTIVPGKDKDYTYAHIREQAALEIALTAFLGDKKASAFTTNFEDLHGLKQLPGLAAQRLMASGFGFAAEGDWKTAAMVRALKVMAQGLPGGVSFMEDYTYNLEPGAGMILGAHMLEVCPSIAAAKPTLEVHPLGIGGKEDPARLVFDGAPGSALCAAVVDMGSRFRLVCNQAQAVAAPEKFAALPVARVLWKPEPAMETACEAWILAGGGHHTAFTTALDAEHLRDFAEICGIECVVIGAGTEIPAFRNELRWNSAFWGK
ncbi:MAG: L-arabinose isomerase [Spirochaetaceae bacterium]|jgi:L-arabinose isomerase|nr:L-arabinose isomerase [Spirochaetaceae bacterium]